MPKPLRARLGLVALAWCLLVASALHADEADDLFAIAAGHYARQEWGFATESFEQLLTDHPNHADHARSAFFLAESLHQLGRHEDAASRFGEYLEAEPKGKLARSARFRAGEALLLQGKTAEAKQQLDQFVRDYPDDKLNAFVLAYQGDLARQADDVQRAEQLYRECLARFPNGPRQDDCRFGLADVLKSQGDAEEAQRIYLALSGKRSSAHAEDAMFQLGALQYAQGEYEEAVETFRAFDTDWPKSTRRPKARMGQGWALMKLDRPVDAAAAFRSTASDRKVGLEARYWLGLALKAQEKWLEAAKILLQTADIAERMKPASAPDNARSGTSGAQLIAAMRYHAGEALSSAERFSEAETQFEMLLDTASEHDLGDDALVGKLRIAVKQNDHIAVDAGAGRFASLFAGSPLEADVQRLQGRSLLERGDHARAVKVLEPLFARGTGNSPVEPTTEDRYLMGLAQKGAGLTEEALATVSPGVSKATGPVGEDLRLLHASLLFTLKRYDEAVGPLRKYVASNPSSPAGRAKGLGQLAICQAKLGNLDEAKRTYGQLTAANPAEAVLVAATEQLADAAYEAKDLAWARELYARAESGAASTDARARGLVGQAWSEFQEGKLAEAVATLDRLLQTDTEPKVAVEAMMLRGRALEGLDRPKEALPMYDRILNDHAQSDQVPLALWGSARILDKLGEDAKAVDRYAKLVEAAPDFERLDMVLYYWAWASADLGDLETSASLFERIHREHPTSPFHADATFRRAYQAFDARDHDTALTFAESLLEAKTTELIRQNARFLIGRIAVAKGDWVKAREVFERLSREHPESQTRSYAEYRVAEADLRLGRFDDADAALRRQMKALDASQESWTPLVRLRLAQVLAEKKEWAEAERVVSEIATRYPDFHEQYEADYIHGRALAGLAKFDRAREAYLRVIRSPVAEKTERAAEAHLMIAETYFHQKDYQNALRQYLEVEILYAFEEHQAAALFQAAKCRRLLGESTEAERLLKRLIQQFPETEYAKEAAGQ